MIILNFHWRIIANGNYFKVNLKNFEINREYKVEFKVERSGSVEYFDNDLSFEVVKNNGELESKERTKNY